MPSTNQQIDVPLPGFPLGLNRQADPNMLELGETPDCLNVDFGSRGEVIKRKGYSDYSLSPASPAGFGFVLSHIFHYRKTDTLDEYVIGVKGVVDGSLWYADTVNRSFSSKATNFGGFSNQEQYPFGGAQFNNLFYITANRGTVAERFDGTTWVQITFTTFDGTSSRFPRAKHLATHQSVMFAANVHDGTNAYRSRLHWSNIDDPETWDAADYIDFDPDDGQEITAIAPYGEDLIVFKNQSVQLLSGRSEATFTRYVLDRKIGTVSHKSVKQVGSELFFFDRDFGVWAFDGNGFRLVSEKINDYLLDGIDYDSAWKASAHVYRNKYYLSVTWEDTLHLSVSPARTFVYDISNGTWTEYDYGVEDAVAVDNYIVGVNARIAGSNLTAAQYGFRRLHHTGLDNALTGEVTRDPGGHVRTPWISLANDRSKFRLHSVQLSIKAHQELDVVSNRPFTVDVLTDWTASTPAFTRDNLQFTRDDVAPWPSSSSYYRLDDSIIFGDEQSVVDLGSFDSERWRAVAIEFSQAEEYGWGSTDEDGNADWQLNKMALTVSSQGKKRSQGIV